MKFVTLGLTLTLCLTNTGCSTMESETTLVPDQLRIDLVNYSARHSSTNVDVIWINPPMKRVKKKKQ